MDKKYLQQQLLNLLEIPSPTGMTADVVAYVVKELKKLGYTAELTNRGAIRVLVKGKSNKRVIGFGSH